MNTEAGSKKVIFFDGYCGLCNGFVDFVLKHDKEQLFQFSPLQSEYAKQNLPEDYTRDLTSVVVQLDGQTLRKARAALAVFHELGGIWKGVSMFGFLPQSILNWGYDLVATNRYKLFGKKDSCRLPTPEERERFLL